MSALELPFVARGLAGVVRVRLEANEHPEETGHSLVAPNFDPEAFRGFPIARAEVEYPGVGPRGMFYWLQTVTQEGVDGSIEVAIDAIHPPYYLFGYLPNFMDAPANPEHPDMDWIARTFLAEDPRVIGSSTFKPVAGFAWGYRLRDGRVTELLGLRPCDASDWAAVQDIYAVEHPELELLPL